MPRKVWQRSRNAIERLEPRLLMAVEPVINEFLAQNTSNLADEDGTFSDWIEIYNPNAASFNLSGYYLTDSSSNLTEWQFPAVTMGANSFLLVWASNKDRRTVGSPLHTNFALSAGGEYLGLVKPDGATIVSEYAPTFPAQSANISYGLLPDGSPTFFSPPTPLAPNASAGVTAVPTFSQPRGFYDTAFSLTLSSTTPGASIRYTTDGSAPSSTAGTLYASPISITTTRNIRAVAYKSGWTPSVVQTASYIFLNDVIHQPASIPGFPNVPKQIGSSGTTVVSDTEMDPNVVNDPAYSSMIKDALKAIPTLSITAKLSDIFGATGFYDTDVEKPGSIELIDPLHPERNSQINGALEPHSHDRLKRSMRISFKPQYGPSKWHTSLLQNAPLNGGGASNDLDHIVLRAGNNRAWTRESNPDRTTYTEDQWVRDTQIAMSGYGARGTFVHLYINGVYWGLYNPTEKPDEGWEAEYFGGDSANWFSDNHDGEISGDATRWNYLTGTLVNQNMAIQSNYDQLRQYLDVDNFSDYLILHWYAAITDWPGNNWYAGNRNDVVSPNRYYAWDGEWSFDRGVNGTIVNGAWVNPAFRNGSTDTAISAKLWRAAKTSPDFMMLFADRVYQNTANNGALTDANAIARWNVLNDDIRNAVVGESARWGDALESLGQPTRTRNVDWQFEVNNLAALMSGNAARLIAALRTEGYYPTIDPPIFSRRGGATTAASSLTLVNPNTSGTIYYTLDGSDPRAPGGGISPSARIYSAAINLSASATLTMRVLDGATWSAMDRAAFTVDPLSALRITELMYHPAPQSGGSIDADEFEYIELQNTGATPLNLSGVKFTDGIDYTFGNTTVQPGAYILLVEDTAAFASRYGNLSNVIGQYSGRLENAGEHVRLETPTGAAILDFTYSNTWQPTTDGGGFSLIVKSPTAPPDFWSQPVNWRASPGINGTPGAANAAPNSAPIVAASGASAVTLGNPATLVGVVSDDGLPSASVSTTWSTVSGPGAVTFANSSSLITSATFGALGTYVLRLTANDGQLTATSDVTVTVKIGTLRVVLINAVTDQDLFPITDGSTIDLAFLPNTSINVRGDTGPALVGSLRFGFDQTSGTFNSNFRTENTAPYSLFGDTNGDYNIGSFSVGSHRIIATPFSGANGTGTVGTPMVLNYTVVNNAAPPAPFNLFATPTGPSTIDLDWRDTSNNETGFRILTSTNGTSYSTLTTVGAGVTHFTHDTLTPGSLHFYRVIAFNGIGDSPASNTSASALPTPGSPPWLSASAGSQYSFAGPTGGQTLTISSGTLSFTSDAAGSGITNLAVKALAGTALVQSPQHLGSMTISGGATVKAAAGQAGTLIVRGLSIASGATLDLADNDLVVEYGTSPTPFTTIRAAVIAGFGQGGAGAGGITSSTSDGSAILALFDNNLVGATSWNGQTISPHAIVGKYTYFGDVNFDGQVTGDDYTIIDSNLNTTPAAGLAWLSGDANLDGLVTGDDYTTIDSNLGLGSGNPLSPQSLLIQSKDDHTALKLDHLISFLAIGPCPIP